MGGNFEFLSLGESLAAYRPILLTTLVVLDPFLSKEVTGQNLI